MGLRGEGYCVGPGYEIEGRMVFDIKDKKETFLLLVRGDKEYSTEDTMRRENAVYVTEEDLRELISSWLGRRLGLL